MKNKLKIFLFLMLIIGGCKKVTIKSIKKLSPVPVYFISNIDKNPGDGSRTIGQFFYRGTDALQIRIEEHMSVSSKIRCILHEVGHAKCLIEKCECYSNSEEPPREEHAYRYVLIWLLIHQQKDLLIDEMIKLRTTSEDEKLKIHGPAAATVRRSGLWRTCKYFVSGK